MHCDNCVLDKEQLKNGSYTKTKIFCKRTGIKNWVYDLIKGDNETVLFAEVPGPEDRIAVRLIDGVLYIEVLKDFQKKYKLKAQIQCKLLISNIEMVY